MREVEFAEQTWDKRKILMAVIALFFLSGVAYAAKTYVFDAKETKFPKKVSTKSSESVAGITTGEENNESSSSSSDENKDPFPFSPSVIRQDAQQKFEEIKNQVTNLTVDDVASASPQIQKVINDLKALEQYPKSQAKQMCENICKSL
ncbi:MAG: hypothetical protein HYV39_03990 [Candidatus Levybacteria bacterium]|nr:hypothetical protein [Candidatus Levybacteria bacterium]